MPELPEVETVVRDLNKKLVGRRITGVWFDWAKMIKSPVKRFEKDIRGEKVVRAARRGKNILVYLTHEKLLLIHQKMTGHLLIGKWKIEGKKVKPLEPKAAVTDPYNGYIHFILFLDNGKMLALSDLRKFAKVILGTTAEIENLLELTGLGPDALSSRLTFEQFRSIIKSKGRTIKQTLMEPTVIAGIGNIYSDDILYVAKVHPRQQPGKLTAAELRRIYGAMRQVLAKAVRLRGTSTSDFRDTAGLEGGYTGYRLVYQREGEPCQRCKTPIKRIRVGGRSAHFCPQCQPAVRLYRGRNGKK